MIKKIYGIIALLLVLFIVGNSAVFAAETQAKIVLEDVTAYSQYPVLKGEAKILVSIQGVYGKITDIQTAINFSGNMQYKGIEYIAAKNAPPESVTYNPNASVVNINKRLTPFIVLKNGIELNGEKTPLYLVTFHNDKGDGLSVNIDNDKDSTYYEIDGVYHTEENPVVLEEVKASEIQVDEKEAIVRIVMDKVTSFAAGGDDNYKNSNVSVEIVSEKTGYTIYTVLNDIALSQGGHRENSTLPTFTVKEKVMSNDTYTVRVKGEGYVTVEKNGVTFNEAIEFTNSDFIPGDMNDDGVVDEKDREIFLTFIENGKENISEDFRRRYEDAADLNRDGKIDIIDRKIFEFQLKPMVSLPDKMEKPSLTAKSDSVEVKWNKAEDSSVTGYIVKYGETSSELNNSLTIAEANTIKYNVTNLKAETDYFFSIAAVNEAGTGEFSDVASIKTLKSSGGSSQNGGSLGENGSHGDSSGGTSSGGSSSGGSSGGGFSGIGGATSQSQTGIAEVFNDIANYGWAKEAIYDLKDKGIIKGVSENMFSPASNIKRGDFILMLSRMISFEGEQTEPFSDVSEGSYYYDAIMKAKAAGIATGDGVSFRPEDNISRQELITLAYRTFLMKNYIEKKDDTASLDAFGDKVQIADYAKEAMASMVNAGIIKGSDGNINPRGAATRAEVAVMCFRLLNLVK